ncbi:NUDIX hydrolase domain-like protein [Syncephalis plumigaleata]|nr:NUDIX hydrolase domain-like protein [Syncephalis plumigaleata]
MEKKQKKRLLGGVRSFATTAMSERATLLKTPRIVVGTIVSRLPQITRDLTDFEAAYFAHREEEARASAPVFPVEFYFKKGSEMERIWKQRERGELSDEAWETMRAQVDGQQVELTDRNATFDVKADNRQSLNRSLKDYLYLVVKRNRDKYQWQFPQGGLESEELLHQAAKRELFEECGRDMDIWYVGRRPVGFHQYAYPAEHKKTFPEHDGAKVFFMRAHIFAGQAQVDGKEVVDFAWLTKNELAKVLEPDYYTAVKDLLHFR